MRLSDLLDLPVFTERGDRLGRVFDVRAARGSDDEHGHWTSCALLIGSVGLLERLGLHGIAKLRDDPTSPGSVVRWEDIVAVEDERIVVREGAGIADGDGNASG